MCTILAAAREYANWDMDPVTRTQIQSLISVNDIKALTPLFSSRLQFGTAGLRAEMGAGYSRMNQLTVLQTTQGVCAYLSKTIASFHVRGIVIGHDHRHNSEIFARITASVFLSQGIKVYYYNKFVHTPLVPFAVKRLGAGGGIMITASHNPKQDNGYKLYFHNGSQIISPHDTLIAHAITQNLVPVQHDTTLISTSSLCIDIFEEMFTAYYQEIVALSIPAPSCPSLKIVYTALHGVAEPFAAHAFKMFNLPSYFIVASQCTPDPDFPTLESPNPEDTRALRLAHLYADEVGAQVVLANDPDGDRLSVSERSADGWYVFTGNEIGTIFATLVWERLSTFERGQNFVMLASAVSSKMIQRIANVEGFTFKETLTGFKWLGNIATDLEQSGFKCLFAYEEALGYMLPSIVKDKDGVSTLALLAQFVHALYSNGSSLKTYLLDIYRKYGVSVCKSGWFIVKEKEKIDEMFANIRYGDQLNEKETFSYPTQIAEYRIKYVRDLTTSHDTQQPNNIPVLPCSKDSNMITFTLENGAVITLRTSGTEPKIKYYAEIFGENRDESMKILDSIIKAFIQELIRPSVYGFA